MKTPILRAIVSLTLLASFASAQEKAKDKKDPQAVYEPRSGPGVGQKFLERFVGDWDVVKTFHPKTGEELRITGVCRQRMLHGGRFLESEFVFGTGDAKTTGTGTIGFETSTGKFTSVWIDSRATRMSFRQGNDPFNGKQIVLFSRGFTPNERQSRTVTHLEDGDRRLVHRQFNLNADNSERLLMELVLTRKAVAVP